MKEVREGRQFVHKQQLFKKCKYFFFFVFKWCIFAVGRMLPIYCQIHVKYKSHKYEEEINWGQGGRWKKESGTK